MEYLVVAFRSRTHTVKFWEYLQKADIKGEIINTPKEAGVGCGLSVKVSASKSYLVKRALAFTNLSSYAGSFLVRVDRNGRVVRNAF